VDNVSETVRWKLVDGQIVHGFPFCIEPPYNPDEKNTGAVYTMGSMAYCPVYLWEMGADIGCMMGTAQHVDASR
jgi:hypothetical protein